MKVARHEMPGKLTQTETVPWDGFIRALAPEVFFIEIAAVSFEEGQIFLFECSRPMMFELLLDVMDGFR